MKTFALLAAVLMTVGSVGCSSRPVRQAPSANVTVNTQPADVVEVEDTTSGSTTSLGASSSGRSH